MYNTELNKIYAAEEACNNMVAAIREWYQSHPFVHPCNLTSLDSPRSPDTLSKRTPLLV